MTTNIKFIIRLLLPALLCFTACDKNIEPIEQELVTPDKQNPALYAAYLTALRAYKASDHYIVYGKLDNAPAGTSSEKAFLRSLPDSLDIVAFANSDLMTQYDIADISGAHAKGTKVLYQVDYNTLAATTDAAALGTYLDGVKAKVVKYGLDGVTASYDGPMTAAATAASALIVEKFATLTGKMLMAEGNPLFIAPADREKVAYFVLNTTETGNTFTVRSLLDYATTFAGIDAGKLIITATPGGKIIDDALVTQPSIAEMARSVVSMGPIAGLGICHIGDDYFDAYVNYKQTKQAINLLNPAYSK